jgi:hypothetical protein
MVPNVIHHLIYIYIYMYNSCVKREAKGGRRTNLANGVVR